MSIKGCLIHKCTCFTDPPEILSLNTATQTQTEPVTESLDWASHLHEKIDDLRWKTINAFNYFENKLMQEVGSVEEGEMRESSKVGACWEMPKSRHFYDFIRRPRESEFAKIPSKRNNFKEKIKAVLEDISVIKNILPKPQEQNPYYEFNTETECIDTKPTYTEHADAKNKFSKTMVGCDDSFQESKNIENSYRDIAPSNNNNSSRNENERNILFGPVYHKNTRDENIQLNHRNESRNASNEPSNISPHDSLDYKNVARKQVPGQENSFRRLINIKDLVHPRTKGYSEQKSSSFKLDKGTNSNQKTALNDDSATSLETAGLEREVPMWCPYFPEMSLELPHRPLSNSEPAEEHKSKKGSEINMKKCKCSCNDLHSKQSQNIIESANDFECCTNGISRNVGNGTQISECDCERNDLNRKYEEIGADIKNDKFSTQEYISALRKVNERRAGKKYNFSNECNGTFFNFHDYYSQIMGLNNLKNIQRSKNGQTNLEPDSGFATQNETKSKPCAEITEKDSPIYVFKTKTQTKLDSKKRNSLVINQTFFNQDEVSWDNTSSEMIEINTDSQILSKIRVIDKEYDEYYCQYRNSSKRKMNEIERMDKQCRGSRQP